MPGDRKFDRYADSLTRHTADGAIVRRVCPLTPDISAEATLDHYHSEVASRGGNRSCDLSLGYIRAGLRGDQ
jgi:hypothetical protein